MKVGDFVLFYHSNCKPPHLAGIAKVCKDGYPDFTAHDSKSNYFDEKSSEENPRWFMVDIEPVVAFPTTISLPEMKANPLLEGMALLQKGQRLSVQPVEPQHFDIICQEGGVNNPTP